MGISDFYIRVVKALDEIGAPYMIVGAYGGSVFGIARSTNDIDMLVDLQEKDIYSILYFCLRGCSDYNVNLTEVTKQAAHLGQETLEM